MRNAKIAAYQHDRIGLLEVRVSVGRSVESERLLISHDGRGHALTRIAIAVQNSHPEFSQGAEQRHLLRDNLARAHKRARLGSVGLLNRLHPLGERLKSQIPADG